MRLDVLIEARAWESRKPLILPNTAAEFRLFADYLHCLKHPVRVVFEATGNYHRPLAHFLMSEGFHLELIASLAVARTREAMHNSWDKNDPKDAHVLLHLLKTGVTQHYPKSDDGDYVPPRWPFIKSTTVPNRRFRVSSLTLARVT